MNPFDELGIIKITLPSAMFSKFKLTDVRKFASHWNIKVNKIKGGDYELSTNDPINLFWFGANVNNNNLPEPSSLSEWVKIKEA